MFGIAFMKRGKDNEGKRINKEGVKPAETFTSSQDKDTSLGEVKDGAIGYGSPSGLSKVVWESFYKHLAHPKTYERLIYDLYTAGWTIEEVKTLLNGGQPTDETLRQEIKSARLEQGA